MNNDASLNNAIKAGFGTPIAALTALLMLGSVPHSHGLMICLILLAMVATAVSGWRLSRMLHIRLADAAAARSTVIHSARVSAIAAPVQLAPARTALRMLTRRLLASTRAFAAMR